MTCPAYETRWRVGGKVPLNVYEDDRPMFQCHTPEDAKRIVDLLNGAQAQYEARERLEKALGKCEDALKARSI